MEYVYNMKDNSSSVSLRLLSSPLGVFLLVIWFLNDVWIKSAYPGLISGKLSDFAGVFLTPHILTAIIGLALSFFKKPGEKSYFHEFYIFIVSILVTTTLFTLINLNQSYNDLLSITIWNRTGGVADPYDLFAFIMLIPSLVPFVIVNQKHHSFRRSFPSVPKSLIVLLFSAMVLVNTASPPHNEDGFWLILFLMVNEGRRPVDRAVLPVHPDDEGRVNLPEFFWWYFAYRDNENNEWKEENPEVMNLPDTCADEDTYGGVFDRYVLQIAEDKNFENVILQEEVDSMSYQVESLNDATGTLYWRVGLKFVNDEQCEQDSRIVFTRSRVRSFELP